jgi:molybdopterin-guanine dinucleotide biosynthesis protein A
MAREMAQETLSRAQAYAVDWRALAVNSFASPETIGFGVLSWRDRDTLRHSLQSYQREKFAALFDRALIYFQEIEPEDRAIAAEFGFEAAGDETNRGILGGFKAMAEALDTDYVLLVENDALLVENAESVIRQIKSALSNMRAGSAQVYRMRHRTYPGQQFAIYKRKRFWPLEDATLAEQAIASLRRLFRPIAARRAAGWTVYYRNDAADRFPDLVRLTPDGDYLVSSASLEWSNNTFLIKRRFFLEHIIAECERRYDGRGINGMPTIEVEANAPWWRKSGLRIGVGKGLFEHYRPAHAEQYGARQSPLPQEKPVS